MRWASEKDTKINWIVVYVYRNGKKSNDFFIIGLKSEAFWWARVNQAAIDNTG